MTAPEAHAQAQEAKDAGASTAVTPPSYEQQFADAILAGELETVASLRPFISDINMPLGEYKEPALHLAALKQHQGVIIYLFGQQASPDAQTSFGFSVALMVLTSKNKEFKNFFFNCIETYLKPWEPFTSPKSAGYTPTWNIQDH